MAILTKIAEIISNKWIRAACQIAVVLAMTFLG